MDGALLIALAASIGNFLQGWDNATIAVAVLYIKREFSLENDPTMEGLIVAMSLVGATVVTSFSGALADGIGRRPMLMISSVLYFAGGLVMLWSPNVYVLLVARLIDGLGIGLVVTLVPIYISETSPSEIRGFLNTFPQFSGSSGMFLSYCMVFAMSLRENPDWRLMLGVLSIPSLLYSLLVVFFLPESPRWLVSKGRMLEAKRVLQRLRSREDVSGEMALLVEGLDVGAETLIEEYIIGPGQEFEGEESVQEKEQMRLYGPEEGLSWVARPVQGQSALGLVSRHSSVVSHGPGTLVDPVVSLFGSVHERMPEMGSMRSMMFPNFGSMFSVAEQQKPEQWDEEVLQQREGDEYPTDNEGDLEESLRSPLLSMDEGHMRRNSSLFRGGEGDAVGIGGGWQLAWRWEEKEGGGGEAGFKRVYLHQEGYPGSRRGSMLSMGAADFGAEGEVVQAAALVSQPALYSQKLLGEAPVGPAMVRPSQSKGQLWHDLLQPGVRHALLVGVGIQIFQQFTGINGVLYYTPQILEQAGVEVLLADLGIGSDAASILISALTTLLMLPCIAVAMRLMDVSGRRRLLLATIPVLILSLVVLVGANVVELGKVAHAALSTMSVVVYFCSFVMGFGPIPNILCAEIFPTRVRGVCIAICSFTFWICDIAVTYSLPLLLGSLGLAGVFSIYAVVCVAALAFVFLKVPETKGMPLEVIIEFFSVGARASSIK
ncbi:tonoplast monosaccharide transporter2 [Wolffia australiana]